MKTFTFQNSHNVDVFYTSFAGNGARGQSWTGWVSSSDVQDLQPELWTGAVDLEHGWLEVMDSGENLLCRIGVDWTKNVSVVTQEPDAQGQNGGRTVLQPEANPITDNIALGGKTLYFQKGLLLQVTG